MDLYVLFLYLNNLLQQLTEKVLFCVLRMLNLGSFSKSICYQQMIWSGITGWLSPQATLKIIGSTPNYLKFLPLKWTLNCLVPLLCIPFLELIIRCPLTALVHRKLFIDLTFLVYYLECSDWLLNCQQFSYMQASDNPNPFFPIPPVILVWLFKTI